MRLNGKVAIVAGAGQAAGDGTGNGRATALAFAREGATLVLANRSMPSKKETQRLVQAEGFDAETVVTDISVEADCKALIDSVVDQHGRVDVLHNNVGVSAADGDTTAIELDNWRSTLDVNVGGAMLLSKHVLPHMREQQSGVITHVGSIAAVASLPLISYKVSKIALNEFTRWLAFENAPHNVRANLLMLGYIDTPLAIEAYHSWSGRPRDEIRAERHASVPMGRMGTAWEVASAAVFLASDESSYLTGAILPIDGGMHTRQG
jgi:NAD(P)-dependent dehydrogenase (short-subunit alcohol dehydrogenase family)